MTSTPAQPQQSPEGLTGTVLDAAAMPEPDRLRDGRTAASDDLVKAGASGAMWLGIASIVGKAVLALTTIVLARLLTPGEFGLVSLSLVIIVYADAVSDAGVGQAMVYLARTRAMTRAALVCSLISGLFLMLLGLAAAPLIAGFFHRPDVAPLVRLLSCGLLVSALAALPEALLRRDLLFNRVTLAAFAKSVVTGGVSITLAFMGFGAWSLAWGTVAGGVAYLIGTWLLTPDRPDLLLWRTTRADLRAVTDYGLPVAGSTLLSRLIFDVDYVIVGRVLGATALGYYTLAFRLPELLIINVFFILSAVAFPIYSQLRDDAERLTGGYLITVRMFSLYGVCAGVGLAVAAPLLVPTVFGTQWTATIAPLVGLALYASARAVGGGAAEVYKAMGRPGLSMWLSLIRLVVLIPALYVAARLWGIVGVAWMQVATSLAFVVLMQGVAVRVMHLRWRVLAQAMLPSLAAGAAIAIVGLPLAKLPVSAPAALAAVVIGGVAATVLCLRLVFPAVFRELLGAIGRRRTAPA